MNSQPKVSVIIPVYNTAQYLSKCLNSVINQTLNEIEIIIVNDGSTDNSQQFINDYCLKDNRIISIEKENGGLSDARNFGIDKAKGEFIAFVDSDDYIDLYMFENMYELAVFNNSDIVFCDLVKVNEKGNEFRILKQSPQLPEKIILKDDFTIFGELSCFACNKIFKKSLFQKHRFLKGIHFEDIELIPKLVLDSKIISKVNKPFYKYFERQDSISKSHNIKGLDMFIAVDNVSDYFEKSDYCIYKEELNRFKILQGYYSYLAYVVFVKDKLLKKEMIERLNSFIVKNHLSLKNIKCYERFNELYMDSLPIKKKLFYKLSFINLNLLSKF